MASVQLWLKPEIFFHGVVCAHQKLNFSYLKKVLAYAKTKGSDGGYPYLNWTIWKHMAVNKMLLSEDLAWTYFNLFYTLTEKDRSHWLQLSENQQKSYEEGNAKSYRDNMKINTLQFVMFLYIQQANKITLRKSMLGEDWPGTNPRLNIKAKVESNSKLSNDSKYLEFVVTHLSQLLEIISESNSQNDEDKHPLISMEAIRALSCFVVGRMNELESVQKLYEIAKKETCRSKNGFDKTSKSFAKAHFISWLTDCLVHNPCDLQACLANGNKLKWSLSEAKKNGSSSSKKSKICYNPNLGLSSHKTVVFFQVNDETVAQQSNILWKSHAMFQKCQKSFFYLLSPLKFVSIEKCTDCTLVFGPVSTSIKVVDCRNVVIIAPCRSCVVYGCSEVTLHISTPNQPIIIQDTGGQPSHVPSVTLAPYNTFYSNLGTHLVEVGLSVSPETNQWNNPAIIDTDSKHSRSSNGKTMKPHRGDGDGVDFKNACILMSPEDFYLFTIPFKNSNPSKGLFETSEIPWKLPLEYNDAVKNKKQAIEKWKQAFRDSKLTREQRTVFQEMIEKRFDQWVSDTGNKKQLSVLGSKP